MSGIKIYLKKNKKKKKKKLFNRRDNCETNYGCLSEDESNHRTYLPCVAIYDSVIFGFLISLLLS